MLRKILALTFAALMLLTFATGCKDKGKDKGSPSKKPTSSTALESVPDENDNDLSSAITENESDIAWDEDEENNEDEDEENNEDTESDYESDMAWDEEYDEDGIGSGTVGEVETDEPEDETSSNRYKWTIETKSAFFRDTDEAKESVTVSNAIKQYKNPHTYQVGAYQLHMQWMESYGTDRESRKKEFYDVCNSGYFNCYLIGDGGYLQDMLPIIAESGGSFWLSLGRFSNNTSTARQDYIKKVNDYLDLIESYGCSDLLLGCYWDEPIWTGMKNENLAEQCRINYQVFGLRNFPIFACGEFSSEEGNSEALGGITADQMRKVLPETCKYVTDIAYDSYNIDVRDGAKYTAETLARYDEATNHVMERKFGRKISSGKDYYIAYKEHLLEYIGHEANFYYFPCAYTANPQGGLVSGGADEAYCQAHLEWMAEDVLADRRGGGVYMYNYKGTNSLSLDKILVLNDEYGYPMMHPDWEKWESYSAALKRVREKFDAAKQTHVYRP